MVGGSACGKPINITMDVQGAVPVVNSAAVGLFSWCACKEC